MNADRDLELVRLALRRGYIDAGRMSVAFDRWQESGSGSLFETMAEVGQIGPRERAELLRAEDDGDDPGDTLAFGADPEPGETVAMEGAPGARRPLAGPLDAPTVAGAPDIASQETLVGGPEGGDATRGGAVIFDQRVEQETLDASAAAGHVRVREMAREGRSSGHYTRTRLHAQGGLGMVWTARDEALGREVALKELRPGRAYGGTPMARFLEEARITGQLEHPSIVPIYELATDPETGDPYYTMRFIRGGTLSDAGNAYRLRRAAQGEDPVAFRALLSAFVDVCQAVAYAHSRGVIHRDLKGQNVVVGEYGEVIVLDWGLAKVLGEPDDPLGAPIDASGDDRSGLETRDGQILGTPAYMPPEQARGEIARIDRRSDVYSLGAMLYEILAGRPPFVGGSTADLLDSVGKGRLDPPRAVDPSAPMPLQAICLKAMSREREDRYQAAAELADEVQRYLADEPVRAYPEPLPARAWRWARKHRSGVAAASLALVASVLALSVFNVLIRRERDRVRAEREVAARAVDEMYTDVAEQWLEDRSDPLQKTFLERALTAYERQAGDEGDLAAPAAAEPDVADAGTSAGASADREDAVQRSFLERSLAYYRKFADGPTDDTRSALEAGRARLRVANLLRKLGKVADADAAYLRTIADLDALAARRPGDPEVARTLALARGTLGDLRVAQGRFEDADALLDRAETAFRGLAEGPGGVDRDRLEWARLLREQAERLKLAGKTTEAEARFRAAIDLLAKLVKADDSALEARHELAQAQDALGVMLLLALDRTPEAADLLRSAMALQHGLVERAPTVPHLRAGLAKTGNTLGLILRAEGDPAGASRAIAASLANYQRLADDFPARVEYRRALARAYVNRGALEQDEGRVADAAATYGRAVDLLAALVAEAPEIAKHHRDLGGALNNRAAMLDRQEALDDAIACYQRAEGVHARLAARFPAVPEYRESLNIDRRNLARALSQKQGPGDLDRAIELASGVEAAFGELVAAHPQVAAYRRGLAESQLQLGAIFAAAGLADKAEAEFALAVEGFRAQEKARPEAIGPKRSLVQALYQRAEVAPGVAEACDREALARVEALCGRPKAPAGDRLTWAVVLNNLGEILEKKGQGAESADLYARSETLFQEQGLGGGEPQRLRYLAYVLTNRGRLAKDQGKLGEAVALGRQAVDHDRKATKLSAANKGFLLEDYRRLGDLMIQAGDHRGAGLLALELVRTIPDVPAARVDAARLLGRCVAIARKGSDGDDAERATLARSYASRGIAQLRVGLDAGYKGIDAIKDDADLKALLAEAEARAILPDLIDPAPGAAR